MFNVGMGLIIDITKFYLFYVKTGFYTAEGFFVLVIVFDYCFGGVIHERSPFCYRVHTPPYSPPLTVHG